MKRTDIDADALRPQILETNPDAPKSDEEKSNDQKAAEWVMDKVSKWRSHRDSNFSIKWGEYGRLWRGIWNAGDKERESERSKFISPAIAQAVESAVAELEEASFGRGKSFTLSIEEAAETPNEIGELERNLENDLQRVNARVALSAAIINAAVYGTGILEMQRVQYIERQPAMKPMPEDPSQMQYGVQETTRDLIVWHPVQPHNFVIDSEAASIEDAMGCAIEEKVSRHIVEQGMAEGLYRQVAIQVQPQDSQTQKDPEEASNAGGEPVKLTRYYGLMPRELVFPAGETEELVEDGEPVNDDEPEEYIEVCAVVMNDKELLKLEESPYMMKERPVTAFQWDIIPNRFWGRGIVEKGYNSQKAHDTILRARFDSLALTVFPMVGVDASRMPKGFKLQIVPGKMIALNGRPSEIFEPFKIGQVDQNLYQEAPQLEKMVFQATGAADMTGVGAAVSGEAKAGAVSMALSAVIKRFKRTLMNFHEQMFVPSLRKTLHMYMQYSPNRYPAVPVTVKPATAMGVIAREYEQQQLVSLLQTMKPDSPAYTAILTGIVENSNLPNRGAINEMIMQGTQPDPEQQQMAKQMQELAIRKAMAEVVVIESQAQLNLARAEYEARYKPQIEMVNAMAEARPDKEGDRQFDKLVKIADIAVKEKNADIKARDIQSNERIVAMQTRADLIKAARAPRK